MTRSKKELRVVKAKIVPENPYGLFLPYQARWIKDNTIQKLMEKSRQIGISWSTAYALVRRKSQKGAQLDAWVSSRDEIQARLFLEDCKAFAQILNVAAQDLGLQIIDEEKRLSAYVLQFSNGLRIHSMSSNPDAQAGKRGDRTFDEFALHRENRKLYAIGEPGLTWGGIMELISTHRGSWNLFNQLVREIKEKGNPKGISLHTVTLQDALDEGFLFKLQQKLPLAHPAQEMDEAEYFDWIKSRTVDEETFQQEYMCQPADDATAFLEYELILSCEYSANEDWEWDLATAQKSRNSLYAGIDIGRDHDLTSFFLLEEQGDVLYQRKQIDLQGMPFSDQEAILYPWLGLPSLRRACIDQTGLGRQFAERGQERFGSYRIEGVTFTAQSKEEMAYPLRGSFEDRKIRIQADPKLRSDLRAVKKETTAAGNIRFAADRGKNGHADRFWGLALARHAAKGATGPVAFQYVSSGGAGLSREGARHLPGRVTV